MTALVPSFSYLGNKTTIEGKLSDHNLIINGDSLFFNMMMQAKYNSEKHRFNNGFAIKIESDEDYTIRIKDCVRLLAEALHKNPRIAVIGLAEAPVREKDISDFISEFKKYPSLSPFADNLSKETFSSWGVATLINAERFEVKRADPDISAYHELKDRIQGFEVSFKHHPERKFKYYNLHFPFDLAQKPEGQDRLRAFVKTLFSCSVPTVVTGDFNVHPDKLLCEETGICKFVPPHNNVLAEVLDEGAGASRKIALKYDTVDGVVYSSSISQISVPFFNLEKASVPRPLESIELVVE